MYSLGPRGFGDEYILMRGFPRRLFCSFGGFDYMVMLSVVDLKMVMLLTAHQDKILWTCALLGTKKTNLRGKLAVSFKMPPAN